jgi:hypothetical protein
MGQTYETNVTFSLKHKQDRWHYSETLKQYTYVGDEQGNLDFKIVTKHKIYNHVSDVKMKMELRESMVSRR